MNNPLDDPRVASNRRIRQIVSRILETKERIPIDATEILKWCGVGKTTFRLLVDLGLAQDILHSDLNQLSSRAQHWLWLAYIETKAEAKKAIETGVINLRTHRNCGFKTLQELRKWCGLPLLDEPGHITVECPHCHGRIPWTALRKQVWGKPKPQ